MFFMEGSAIINLGVSLICFLPKEWGCEMNATLTIPLLYYALPSESVTADDCACASTYQPPSATDAASAETHSTQPAWRLAPDLQRVPIDGGSHEVVANPS